MDIKRSKKLDDGVCIWFDNGWYYAHGIEEIGDPSDAPNNMRSMWGWINHMRAKRWWYPLLEQKFIKETSKYF